MAKAWPNAFTAVNIMASFKKTGVYPLNPSEVTDRQKAPKAFGLTSTASNPRKDETSKLCLFSKEQGALYQRRYEEKYDIKDPDYLTWVKINHPETNVSSTEVSSVSSDHPNSTKSSEVLSEILVLPEPKVKGACKKTKAVTCQKQFVLQRMKFYKS